MPRMESLNTTLDRRPQVADARLDTTRQISTLFAISTTQPAARLPRDAAEPRPRSSFADVSRVKQLLETLGKRPA